ncbi:MAG: hypothetical protein RXR16_01320 [Thermocladium sp.]
MSFRSIIDVMEYQQDIRLLASRDIPEVRAGDYKIGPLKAGDPIRVPPSVALFLISRGFAQLIQQDFLSLEDLRKIHWRETKSINDLQELDRGFYVRARLSMAQLGEQEAKQYEQTLKELAQARLRKLLNTVAVSPSLVDTREYLDKLPIEEEAIVREVSRIARSWVESMVITSD